MTTEGRCASEQEAMGAPADCTWRLDMVLGYSKEMLPHLWGLQKHRLEKDPWILHQATGKLLPLLDTECQCANTQTSGKHCHGQGASKRRKKSWRQSPLRCSMLKKKNLGEGQLFNDYSVHGRMHLFGY